MLEGNLCYFANKSETKIDSEIIILNYVLEANPNQVYKNFIIRNAYCFNVVLEGEGIFETLYRNEPLVAGDFFITYPSTSHKVISTKGLKYAYISFIGNNILLYSDKLIVSKDNLVVHNQHDLAKLYKNSLKKINDINLSVISQGLYYFTLSYLLKPDNKDKKNESHIASELRKQIETNYSDSSISLNSLADSFGYNPNYLSLIFKKEFGVTFSMFLQNTRISSAMNLINSGFTSIKEISNLVGFNDPLYFSKTFKKAYSLSPTKIIKDKNKLYKTNK